MWYSWWIGFEFLEFREFLISESIFMLVDYSLRVGFISCNFIIG